MPSVVFTVGALHKYTVVCQCNTTHLFPKSAYKIICSPVLLSSMVQSFAWFHITYMKPRNRKKSVVYQDKKYSYHTRLNLSHSISCLRQCPVVDVSGGGMRVRGYVWLNMLTARLASYLPVLAWSWHMPWSMRLYSPNLMLFYLILDYQLLKPQGKFWFTELYCK